MEINVDIRQKQLDSLAEFISISRGKVQSILEDLNWKLPKEADNMSSCKKQPSHRVPIPKLKAHTKMCALKLEGYKLNEQFLSEPKVPSNESIYVDDKKKIEILAAAGFDNHQTLTKCHLSDPKTSDRLFCTYTSDERCALYKYVVNATKPPQQAPEFNLWSDRTTISKPDDKKLSIAEIEAQERDARRRRMKHKPKSVYAGKKCYTEIIKQVIESQMEQYEDWLEDQTKNKKCKTEK